MSSRWLVLLSHLFGALPRHSSLYISGGLLIAANLIPLVGVLLYDWNIVQIMMIYWAESAIIGVLNVVRIIVSGGFDSHGLVRPLGFIGGLFLAAFFVVHFGGFMFGHALFLVVLSSIGQAAGGAAGLSSGVDPDAFFGAMGEGDFEKLLLYFEQGAGQGALWALVALFGSHFVSLIAHFFLGQEFRRLSAPEFMVRPYGRIVLMHATIIAGIFALVSFGDRLAIVIIWVIAKTFTDLRGHLKEHAERGRRIPVDIQKDDRGRTIAFAQSVEQGKRIVEIDHKSQQVLVRSADGDLAQETIGFREFVEDPPALWDDVDLRIQVMRAVQRSLRDLPEKPASG